MGLLKENDVPIHKQLESLIMESIHDGALSPGDLIWSENSLVKKYGISRTTVRKVYERLVTKGILIKRAGKGTYVAHPVATENISLLVGFSEKMSRSGRKIETKLIKAEEEEPSEDLREKLKLDENDKIIEIVRIRYIDNIPFIIQTAYLSYKKCKPVLNWEIEKGSLTAFMQNILGIELTQAEESIYVVSASEKEAGMLEVQKNFPLLIVEGLSFDCEQQPVRYSYSQYRSDVVRLTTIHKKIKE